MVKDPPVAEGDARDTGSIPGFPGGENGKRLQYSCLGNPGTEEPGRLQSTGSQKSDMTEHLSTKCLHT